MDVKIYEGRAEEFDEQISGLLEKLHELDPVTNEKEYAAVVERIETLHSLEEGNAKLLLDAESNETDRLKAANEAIEVEARNRESKRWLEKIDLSKVAVAGLGVVMTLGIVRYEADPEGGYLPSKWISNLLRMFH